MENRAIGEQLKLARWVYSKLGPNERFKGMFLFVCIYICSVNYIKVAFL